MMLVASDVSSIPAAADERIVGVGELSGMREEVFIMLRGCKW